MSTRFVAVLTISPVVTCPALWAPGKRVIALQWIRDTRTGCQPAALEPLPTWC